MPEPIPDKAPSSARADPATTAERRPLVSIVTAAYNEEENLPILHSRLAATLDSMSVDWEWFIVDDHSLDRTFDVMRQIAADDPRVHGLRLSRNFGSHAARLCGLHRARGACAVAMAADLQDPPEVLPALLSRWREGAHMVLAVRERRLGESGGTIVFSRIYHWTLRTLAGFEDMPATGSSFWLVDRRVLDVLGDFRESHTTLHGFLHWMGFRVDQVSYIQQPRLHGRSGWTLSKKIKLFVDSIVSFSSKPIQAISLAGLTVTTAGLLSASWLATRALGGSDVQGWVVVLAATLFLGGLQMTMLGLLGEYLWRSFAEVRRRPPYIIEEDLATSRIPHEDVR